MLIVSLGEIMMRLSNPIDTHINKCQKLNIYFGGGEYNTLVNLSCLGYKTEFITTLPINKLSDRIMIEAQMYGVGTKFINYKEGRLGTYYTLLGDEYSRLEVIYDRTNSSFANSDVSEYNFAEIFKDVTLFHVSGITAALNNNIRKLAYEAIKYAHENGIQISYDSNFRAKLWSQEAAGEFLSTILKYVDYAFLGILDIKYLLRIDVEDLEEGYRILQEKYSNIKCFSSTNRTVISTHKHLLQVNYFDGQMFKTEKVKLNVKDRIGGGDVFTAGILDGILQKKKQNEIINFALANAILKHQRYGDNCFINRLEVQALCAGNNLIINR